MVVGGPIVIFIIDDHSGYLTTQTKVRVGFEAGVRVRELGLDTKQR